MNVLCQLDRTLKRQGFSRPSIVHSKMFIWHLLCVLDAKQCFREDTELTSIGCRHVETRALRLWDEKAWAKFQNPWDQLKLRVQVMGHKAERQKKQNAVPHTPLRESDKAQYLWERFPSQMTTLFQNLLTGLIFYTLGNPLMVNLIAIILDKWDIRAILPIKLLPPFTLVTTLCTLSALKSARWGEGNSFLFLTSSIYHPRIDLPSPLNLSSTPHHQSVSITLFFPIDLWFEIFLFVYVLFIYLLQLEHMCHEN